jgi:predicted amidophosphoribosyltransferase
LLNAIKSGRPDSISAAASLMAYQWLACKRPLPDLIIPLPCTFWEKQKIGFDPHHMLASEIGKVFSAPVHIVLRKAFDHTHFLSHGEFRHRIEVSHRRREVLCDKKILLVAPSLDDTLFRSIGHELKAFFPTQVDALAFAVIE